VSMHSADEPPRRAFRIWEVAEMLGVNERTLRGWIAAGHLRVSRPAGRTVLIESAALDEFMARPCPPTSLPPRHQEVAKIP
jgi:excisionase family DNA binding protein